MIARPASGGALFTHCPRVATSIALAVMISASLAPGLLPRSALTQAFVTGIFAAIGMGVAALVRWDAPRARGVTIAVCALVVGAAIVAAARWQNSLRAAMGAPSTGPLHWLGVVVGAGVVCGVVVGGIRVAATVTRRIGVLPCLALGGVVALVGVPAVVDWRQAAYRTSSAALDIAVSQPLSPLRSGSPDSLAAWQSLGAEGRKFVGGTGDSVRVYVGIDSAPDLDDRVELAIRELDRTGGFARSNVVVAVPTGSGWIDANAVNGLEQRFDGDVAVVGIQYSYAPSWATFVFGRDEAVAAATALYDAVAQRISESPNHSSLYLYGQSLGSVGGSAALRDHPACAALWAGPPAGTDTGDAVVLANSSDPVVRWSPRLLVAPPDLADVRDDAPAPPWIPVVSFVQTTVDLFDALEPPAGHGHRYGTDQGTAMPGC